MISTEFFQIFSDDLKDALDAAEQSTISLEVCAPLKHISVGISPTFLYIMATKTHTNYTVFLCATLLET